MKKPPPTVEVTFYSKKMDSSSPPAQKVVNSDEESSKETVARHAKWWYSAFHIVTATVGAGVLSLPYAMAYLGWGPGAMVLVLSWCITLNTMWQMIQLHEFVTGKRFDRYYELGQCAFGPKLGLWVVLPQQLIVQVGSDIVYMVIGGKCLKKFMDIAFPSFAKLHLSYWICIFGSIHFFLSQLPNFNSVAGVSLVAAVMSLSYSTISWVVCLTRGPIPNVGYSYKTTSTANALFRVCNALGQMSFAFASHGIVLEIQATVPSTPGKPSKIPMWKGAVVAYLITAICYFPTALVGYWAFGHDVADNLLLALRRPEWLIAAANLMVVIHVVGSYQVYAMPVFDMLERFVVKMLKVPRGLALRLIVRTAYVVDAGDATPFAVSSLGFKRMKPIVKHYVKLLKFTPQVLKPGIPLSKLTSTLFIAVTFPFFGDLLGFFGGFAFAPSAFFVPSIIWLVLKKPRRFSISWMVNWACICIGSLIMCASTIGGFRNIIIDASTYGFYS